MSSATVDRFVEHHRNIRDARDCNGGIPIGFVARLLEELDRIRIERRYETDRIRARIALIGVETQRTASPVKTLDRRDAAQIGVDVKTDFDFQRRKPALDCGCDLALDFGFGFGLEQS